MVCRVLIKIITLGNTQLSLLLNITLFPNWNFRTVRLVGVLVEFEIPVIYCRHDPVCCICARHLLSCVRGHGLLTSKQG